MFRQAAIALVTSLPVVLFSIAVAHGQNSHRVLDPPDGIDRNALSQGDQIRELLKRVEAAESLKRGSIEDVDPELLRAVQQWAKQMEASDQTPPELTGFLESIRDRISNLPSDAAPGELPFPGGESTTPPPGSAASSQQRKAGTVSQGDPQRGLKPSGGTRPDAIGQKTTEGQVGSHNPKVVEQKSGKGNLAVKKSDRPGGDTSFPGKLPGDFQAELPQTPSQLERDNLEPHRDKLDALRDSGLTIQQQLSRVMEQARREAILDGIPASASDGVAKWIEETIDDARRTKSTKPRSPRTPNQSRTKKKSRSSPKKSTQQSSGSIPKTGRTPTGKAPTSKSRHNSSSNGKIKPSESTITGSFTERFRKMANRAEKTFDQVAQQETQADFETAQPSGSEDSDAGESSAQSSSSVQRFLTLALLLGIIAIAYWLWQRQSVRRAAVTLAQLARSLPADLRTREDVLLAFHILTARTIEVRNRWWTHHRAASELMAVNPSGRKAIEALTVVYEQARYLPPEVPLSSGHLKEARQVLTLCSS